MAALVTCAALMGASATASGAQATPSLKDKIVDRSAISDVVDAPQPAGAIETELGVAPCNGDVCASIERATDEERARVIAAERAMRTNGKAQLTAIQPVPDLCKNAPSDGVWDVVSRTQACGTDVVTITVYEQKSNGTRTTRGQLRALLRYYAYTVHNDRVWAHQMEVIPTDVWGWAQNTTVTGQAACVIYKGASGACGTDTSSFKTQTLSVGKTAAGEAYQKFTGTNPSWGQGAWNLTFAPPGTNTLSLTEHALPVRCDAITPNASAGCVFSHFTPTLWYSRTELPSFAQHVEAAQASGLPGRTVPLHRLTDSTLVSKNGSTACPTGASWLPRPSGHQCDEYPFRSTYEGAFTGGGKARTYSWCQIKLREASSTGSIGFSICMIPTTQNRTAGNQLGSFYRINRVLDNDPFYVRVKV